MKIRKKQKKSIKIILLLVALVLGAASMFVYWNGRNVSPDANTSTSKTSNHTDINYAPSTKEQQSGGESAKKDLASQDSASSGGELPVELSVFKKSDGEIHVTVNIQGLVTSDGRCELTVKNDSDTKKQQAGTVAVTDYSTCKGFDITNLRSGLWQVQINVTSGNKSGSSSTSIEV